MGMPYKRVGTLVQDRFHAVIGELGKDPHTIPFTVDYRDASRGLKRRLAFRLVNDPNFTPKIAARLGVGLPGELASESPELEHGTFTGSYAISTDSLGTIRQQSTTQGINNFLDSLAPVLAVCQDNPYGPVAVTGVHIDFSYNPQPQSAFIERVVPDRQVAHPGDTVNLDITLRPYGKAEETKRVAVTVPPYTNDPLLLLAVTSGGAGGPIRQQLTPPFYAEEGVKGMVRWLTAEIPESHLLVAAVFPSPSIAFHGQFLPNLPAPVLSCLRAGELLYPSTYLPDLALGQ